METDRAFSGSIPAVYDHFLGPLIFAPYAGDIAGRLSDLRAGRLLKLPPARGLLPAPWPLTRPRLW
jgi:hypothetical protein